MWQPWLTRRRLAVTSLLRRCRRVRRGHCLDAVAEDRLEGLFVLALATGLRQGEALGLKWDDVDLVGGSLTVRRALQRVNGTST